MQIVNIIKKLIFIILIMYVIIVRAEAIEIVLKVALNPNLPPYQFEENGKFKGLHIDIMESIAKKNNLIIEYIPMSSNNKCLESLSNGEVDIVLGAISNNKYEKQATDNISQSSIIMIANKDYAYLINNKRDYGNINTVFENDTIGYSYIRKMRNLHYIIVSNQIRAFNNLISGEADALIGVKNSILYQLEKSKTVEDYTIVTNYMAPIQYTILTQNGDGDLRKLLNNELQRIRISGEYTKIYEKWINEDKYIIKKIMNSIIIMIFVFLVILFINFIFNYRLNTLLKKEVDEKTKELKIINNDLQKQIIETRNTNELKNCIVEHSISAIFAIDTDYKITLFSKSACNITNIHNLNIGYDAFDIPLLETILKSILNKLFVEDIKIINEELTIKDEENNSKSYRYDIYQLYNFDNSIRGAIITIEDITEELKIKDQIFEREKNKALNQIIAGIAHEIRNPLTSIKAFIQLIPAKIDNQKFQNQLTEIVPKEVDRVNNLIKDLIDYAKPETNNKNIIDLSEIINSCIFLIKPTLNKKKIELILSEEKNLQLYVDKNQIKQILINIILNGLESMAEKISKFNITNNLQININTFSKGDNVCITIVDEGMGMTEEQIKKSFEPFYTSKSYGTGLGLSLSKQFVEENNGTLTIESEPLLFTKVTIKFRRVS
ncbi:MAG: transporter substrate-binding domain-containing protein [Tissierellia bacterium]|nr:transporter substrate-binding domain-containing protein [Tissierellia bacterium]